VNPPRHRRFSLTRHKFSLWALPAFGLILVAAVWVATWVQLQATERASIGAAIHETENFAASFERFTQRTIRDADRMTRLVKHEFERYGTHDLPRLTQASLVDGGGPVVISIADAKGDIVARSQLASPFSIADREYFRQHAERDTGQLDISKPIFSRASGRSTILLSRRLNHPDGSFAGIVLLGVAPEYFMEFYQEADLGKQGRLGLLGVDGVVRARRVGDETTSVSDGSEARLVARAAENPVGHYEARGNIDQVLRIVAYRKLPEHPFIVTAAQATDEALAHSLSSRTNYWMIAALVTVVIVIFFSVVTVLARRLQRNRHELKSQRHFLRTLVNNLPSGIAVRSMRPRDFGRYVLWNESNEAMFGVKAEAALDKTLSEVLGLEPARRIVELDRQLLASPMVQEVFEAREIRGRGRRIFHFVRAPIFGARDEVEYIMTSANDITEERRRTDELQLASKVFETTADAIVMSDADDRVVMVNAAFSKLTGYDAQEIVGKILAESPFRPIDVAESEARMERQQRDGTVTGEVPRFRKDGTPLSLWVSASTVRNDDGSIRNYLRVFTDISLLKETQRKLEKLASHDTLTGLPNRRLLHDRLEHALLRAERHHVSMALMFIDLDGFKDVNDTLGHDVGDLLLRDVAARLATCIRASDTIARFGGDEFAIVLEDACLPADAERVCLRIAVALATPFDLNGHRVSTAASVGVAIYPLDGGDATTLLKNADVAMYKAKRTGRNCFKFFADAPQPVAVAD
jgi:diguanylate cyclase (GGDEF)-like protein/PAS domain S-box-containing protein